MKRLATIVLAFATALSSFTPSFAENSNDPHSAQSRGSFGDSGANNNRSRGCDDIYRCGGGRYRYGNNRYHGDNRYYRNNYNDHGYYRHNDNGAAAVIGGLAAGAIIGGIIASQQPRARSYGSSHVDWCYSRYRSYRSYDNTFQPNYGPRRQCVSP
jgi:hypothetical protein